jgi:hypothetical protein
MTKEQATVENESVNPDTLPPKASDSRKKELTDKFVSLGHPAHEAERAFFQKGDRLPEDDLEALNEMLNINGYASVMPEDADRVLKEAKKAEKAEAKAEKEEAKADKKEK